jgi:hypothetical protein
MSPLLHGSLTLLLSISLVSPLQQRDITGDWYFDRFGGPHGEIANSPEITKANKQFKGMLFTFGSDGKLRKTNGDGTKPPNATTNYKVFYQLRKVIVARDTLRIMLLTSDILELYDVSENYPAMFLKRNKNGKTAMSAP